MEIPEKKVHRSQHFGAFFFPAKGCAEFLTNLLKMALNKAIHERIDCVHHSNKIRNEIFVYIPITYQLFRGKWKQLRENHMAM